jgi:hypothetical protein
MPAGIEDMPVRLIGGCARAHGRDVGRLSLLCIEGTLEEIHECPRLGGRGASGRKHGPQVEWRKTPFLKDRTDRARS